MRPLLTSIAIASITDITKARCVQQEESKVQCSQYDNDKVKCDQKENDCKWIDDVIDVDSNNVLKSGESLDYTQNIPNCEGVPGEGFAGYGTRESMVSVFVVDDVVNYRFYPLDVNGLGAVIEIANDKDDKDWVIKNPKEQIEQTEARPNAEKHRQEMISKNTKSFDKKKFQSQHPVASRLFGKASDYKEVALKKPLRAKEAVEETKSTVFEEIGLVMSFRQKKDEKCSGTIIGSKHVLTAAHCVSQEHPMENNKKEPCHAHTPDNPNFIWFFPGFNTKDRPIAFDGDKGHLAKGGKKVSRVFIPLSYLTEESISAYFDYAILEFEEPVFQKWVAYGSESFTKIKERSYLMAGYDGSGDDARMYYDVVKIQDRARGANFPSTKIPKLMTLGYLDEGLHQHVGGASGASLLDFVKDENTKDHGQYVSRAVLAQANKKGETIVPQLWVSINPVRFFVIKWIIAGGPDATPARKVDKKDVPLSPPRELRYKDRISDANHYYYLQSLLSVLITCILGTVLCFCCAACFCILTGVSFITGYSFKSWKELKFKIEEIDSRSEV